MENQLSKPVNAVIDLFPPKPNGFFEKCMEVGKLFLITTPIAIIGQTAQMAIQTYGLLKENEQKVKAVKYFSNTNEMKYKAELEARKIQNCHSEITLYIDKKFQNELDKINKEFQVKMYQIKNLKETSIYNINKYAQIQLNGIDKHYSEIIRENEVKCALYREFLFAANMKGVSSNDVGYFLTKSFVENIKDLEFEKLLLMKEMILEMMKPTNFVSFEEFIGIRRK